MTSGAMTRLYAKLALIEREGDTRPASPEEDGGADGVEEAPEAAEGVAESRAIVQERAGAVRILTKSVSVSSGYWTPSERGKQRDRERETERERERKREGGREGVREGRQTDRQTDR